MSTLTRKQREVYERELMLLDVARTMLIRDGYFGLNLDRLAEVTEYSKGTVYKHFLTKEDLVTALAVQTMEQRRLLFSRAARFVGRPRERFLALGVADELFGTLYPHHYQSELIIKMARLDERVSAERRTGLRTLEQSCLSELRAIIDDAVAVGDLVLTPPRGPSDVVYAVLSLVVGSQMTRFSFRTLLDDLGIEDLVASSRYHIHAILDGFHWRPLLSEWDYDSTLLRIFREVFPDESRRAGLG